LFAPAPPPLALRIFALCALALSLLVAVPAAAQDAPGPSIWDYSVKNQLKPGQKAELTLKPKVEVRNAVLTLKAKSGETATFEFARMPANTPRTVKWKVPYGASHWTGNLLGTVKGSTVHMTVNLKVISAAQLDVKVPKPEIDVEAGEMVLISNNPLDRVELRGFDHQGEQVIDATIPMEGAKGRVPLTFDVPEDTKIRRLEMKVHDQVGYWMSVRLVDFHVEIPHEDVEFATAQFEVPIDQVTRLDHVVMQVQDELNKFRKELGDSRARIDARLYVAGFTDTVGKASDNDALSRQRAEAIAMYFWSNGIGVPIFYAGFGENGLAVPTPDETDEAKNRRARYILTNTRPRIDMGGRQWKRLK